jgi:hypothetical protein
LVCKDCAFLKLVHLLSALDERLQYLRDHLTHDEYAVREEEVAYLRRKVLELISGVPASST